MENLVSHINRVRIKKNLFADLTCIDTIYTPYLNDFIRIFAHMDTQVFGLTILAYNKNMPRVSDKHQLITQFLGMLARENEEQGQEKMLEQFEQSLEHLECSRAWGDFLAFLGECLFGTNFYTKQYHICTGLPLGLKVSGPLVTNQTTGPWAHHTEEVGMRY